ncbi:MAG: hypothetical protein OXR73_13165, partial [Myxococcales bacterium]|nr:hypothetical protein [Myxococcales bacterium]
SARAPPSDRPPRPPSEETPVADPSDAFRDAVRRSSRPPAGGRGSFRPRTPPRDTAMPSSWPPPPKSPSHPAKTSDRVPDPSARPVQLENAFGLGEADNGFGQLPVSLTPRPSAPPLLETSSNAPPAAIGFAPTERAIQTPRPAAPESPSDAPPPVLSIPLPAAPESPAHTASSQTASPEQASPAEDELGDDDPTLVVRRPEQVFEEVTRVAPQPTGTPDLEGPAPVSEPKPAPTAEIAASVGALGEAAKQLTDKVVASTGHAGRTFAARMAQGFGSVLTRSQAPPRGAPTGSTPTGSASGSTKTVGASMPAGPASGVPAGDGSHTGEEDAVTAQHPRAAPKSSEPAATQLPGTSLDDETLDAIGEALRDYPEVEWACALPPEQDIDTSPVALRIDPLYDQRTEEITERALAAAKARGAHVTVQLLKTTEQVRLARRAGTVFFPGRKRAVRR